MCKSKVMMNGFENNLMVERYTQSQADGFDRLVAKAVDFIKRNARRPIQVRDVVEYVAVSRREIERRFKKTLNRSIHREIKQTRVRLIADMLLETPDTVSQIASRLGFSDIAHFARYFRDIEGVSPLEYRKKNLCTV
jgi:LacI family transcriptional regulator